MIAASCRYLHPARYGDDIVVTVTPQRSSVARLTFRYAVRHGHSQSRLAEGETTSVVTDATGRLLLRLPNRLAGFFNPVDSDAIQRTGSR